MKRHILPFLVILLFSVRALAQSSTFNYTGSVQSYTVPVTGTFTIDMAGGAGGSGDGGSGGSAWAGGLGGRVVCSLSVTAGQVLSIIVAGAGTTQTTAATAPGGYLGGGNGTSLTTDSYTGGGGGGASYIITGGDSIIIAGGGGGGAYDGPSCTGGAGGGLTGGNGAGVVSHGNGGTQSAGGSGSVNGLKYKGGNGGGSPYYDGGGGGGGYYGGGSGSVGGGGGGSSYTNPTYVTAVTHTPGYRAGNGYVIITRPACVAPTAPTISSTANPYCESMFTDGFTLSIASGSLNGAAYWHWYAFSCGDYSLGTGTTAHDNPSVGTTAYYARGEGGCLTTPGSCGTLTVIVEEVPTSLNYFPSSTVCVGSSINYQPFPNPLGGSGTWSISNSSVAVVDDDGNVSGLQAGIATVSYTYTTSSCGSATVTAPVTVAAGPSVTVNPVSAICQGATTAALGGSYGGSATSATWDDGGAGGTFSSDNLTGLTPNLTTYTATAGSSSPVTLTLTTGGGSCGNTSGSTTLVVNPNPTVSVNPVSTICQGGATAALGGAFGGGATAAIWSDGDAGGTFSSDNLTGLTPNLTVYTASTGSSSPVTLTLTTSGGSCGNASTFTSLTVNPNPTVSVNPVAAICQGGTTAALNGSFGGGATSATWSDGGAGGVFSSDNLTGLTPNLTTYTASASSSSPVTLTLTTSGGSCGNTSTTTSLVVNPNPIAGAITSSTQSVCTGYAIFYADATGANGTGSWSSSNYSIANIDADGGGEVYGVGGSAGGVANITYTVTSGVGCGSSSTSLPVTVNPLPTVSVSSVAAICEAGTTAPLGGRFGGGATSATWDDGGAGGTFSSDNLTGLTPNLTTYTASAGSSSPVYLRLTTSSGPCGNASTVISLTVNPNPTVSVNPVAAICQGGTTAALGGSFGGGASAATWSDGDAGGTFSSDNTTGLTPNLTTYTASAGSSSPVTLTLTTSGGSCGNTSTTTSLVVNPNPIVSVNPVAAICQGGTTAALSGGFGGAATSAIWDDGGAGGTFSSDNLTGLTPNLTTYTASAGSSSPVYLILTTSGGYCGNTSASTSLVINPYPSLAVLPIAPICQGGTATAIASASVPVNTVLLSQNFNDGLAGQVGGTWTISSPGAPTPAGNWTVTDASYSDISVPGDGTPFAYADPNYDGIGSAGTVTSLISPAFSTVGYTAAALTLNTFIVSASHWDRYAEIDYSVDNGATWTQLYNLLNTSVGTTAWSASVPTLTIPLPPGSLNQPSLTLRWFYYSFFGYYWAVDNVVVTADSMSLPASDFAWSGPSTISCTSDCNTTMLSPAASGVNIYTVSATNAGCSSSVSFDVTVNPTPSAYTVTGGGSYCSGGTGVDVGLSNSDAGISYELMNGATPVSSLPGGCILDFGFQTAAGTYTVVAANTTTSCSSIMTGNATVIINPLPTVTAGNVSVCAGSTVTLAGAPSGGTWSVANPYSNSTPGSYSYTYTYTDGNSCTATAASSITDNAVAAITSATAASGSVCPGTTTAITASGVVGADASLTWYTGSGGTGADLGSGNPLTGVGPGVYYAYVTGTCGTAEASVTIGAYTNVSLASVIPASSEICPSATTTITASFSGTGAVLDWFYTPLSGSSSSTYIGSSSTITAGPGDYLAYVVGTCGSTSDFLAINAYTNVGITSATAASSPICPGTTTTITANGVTGSGATVTWYTGSGGSGTNLGTGSSISVGPGTYYAYVTGTCGSPAQASVTVGISTLPTVSISSSNNLTCTATSATLTASGASTYTWSGSSAISSTRTVTTAGAYTVTGTGSDGCSATATYTESLTTTPLATPTVTVVNNCGSSILTAAGSVSGATVTWSPAGSGNPLTVTSSGSYWATQSLSGCTSSSSAPVTAAPIRLTLTPTITNVSCHGGSNGSITVAVAGGSGSYTYSWSGSSCSGSSSAGITGKPAGTYTVTVTNGECHATGVYTITQPSSALSLSGSVTNVTCYGGDNGKITTTVTGGTPAYSYLWSPGSATTSSLSGKAAGTYGVTITDAHGCVASGSYTVTQPAALTCAITATPGTTVYTGGVPTNIYLGYGPQTVTLAATATGGSGFTYLWSSASGTSNLSNVHISNPVFTATLAGHFTYVVTITNSDGCTTTCTVSICVIDAVDHSHSGHVLLCHAYECTPVTLSLTPAQVLTHLPSHCPSDHLGPIGSTCSTSGRESGEDDEKAVVINELTVNAFPNPFNSEVNVKVQSNLMDNVDVVVYDVTGRVMEAKPGQSVESNIIIGQKLVPGIYIIEVRQGDEVKKVKVVKY